MPKVTQPRKQQAQDLLSPECLPSARALEPSLSGKPGRLFANPGGGANIQKYIKHSHKLTSKGLVMRFYSVTIKKKRYLYVHPHPHKPFSSDELTALSNAERQGPAPNQMPFLLEDQSWRGFLQPDNFECDRCKVQTGLRGKHLCFARLL